MKIVLWILGLALISGPVVGAAREARRRFVAHAQLRDRYYARALRPSIATLAPARWADQPYGALKPEDLNA